MSQFRLLVEAAREPHATTTVGHNVALLLGPLRGGLREAPHVRHSLGVAVDEGLPLDPGDLHHAPMYFLHARRETKLVAYLRAARPVGDGEVDGLRRRALHAHQRGSLAVQVSAGIDAEPLDHRRSAGEVHHRRVVDRPARLLTRIVSTQPLLVLLWQEARPDRGPYLGIACGDLLEVGIGARQPPRDRPVAVALVVGATKCVELRVDAAPVGVLVYEPVEERVDALVQVTRMRDCLCNRRPQRVNELLPQCLLPRRRVIDHQPRVLDPQCL